MQRILHPYKYEPVKTLQSFHLGFVLGYVFRKEAFGLVSLVPLFPGGPSLSPSPSALTAPLSVPAPLGGTPASTPAGLPSSSCREQCWPFKTYLSSVEFFQRESARLILETNPV